MPKTNATGAGDAGAPFTLPADLSSLTAEQLTELLSQANTEMDALLAERDPAKLPRAGELSTARKAIMTRQGELAAEQAEIDSQFEAYAAELAAPETEDEGGEGEEPPAAEPALVGEIVDPAPAAAPATPSPQLVTASGRPTGGTQAASRDTGGLSGGKHSINPALSRARAAAPPAEPPKPELAITASVGMPGQFEPGAKVPSLRALGDLLEQRAKSMADQGGRYRARRAGDPYGGIQVASVRNDFGQDVFTDNQPPDAIQAYIERVQGNRLAHKMAPLVAAGGWCAPSQIRYDFFNIACEGGAIDLPTFGVERGGIQFPDSPSLADTFSPAIPWYTAFSNATVPWLWTEGDDILAVTGAPTKPCIRVPCSTMIDERLECYGICLTAGNLADNAWPESTRNFLKLLMAAHFHAANARYIATISAGAVAITGCTAAGSGAAAPILSTAELAAIDYRAKFGMCDEDVIEWVYPAWFKGLVRADLAKRTGVSDFMCVPDSEIARWFDCRNIRAQFVQDYQVRAAGQPGAAAGITTYPSVGRGLMYAAGTVARGNGMTLDLGVVRDSTLNETNDFTAAWMEECHLIAQFGHEVREYAMNLCADGTTGAADLTSCCP